MKRTILVSAMGLLAGWSTFASAEEVGRVITSTPVTQQVAVPRQVCSNQPVAVQQPSTGAGAIMGGIAGGAMGNAIGGGSGRAAATAIGLIGGAIVGNNIEGSGGTYVQNVQQCSTQTFYENRTVGYNVVYEYAGKEFSAQMPYDPGPTIRLQLTPMASNESAPAPVAAAESGSSGAPGTPIGVIVGTPTVTTQVAPVAAYPAYPAVYPAYPAYPVYAPRPYYYPPIGFSLNLGYSRGWHHHRHR